MYKKMKKEKKLKLQKIDEMTENRQIRATFVNYRRKLVGGLVVDSTSEEDAASFDAYSDVQPTRHSHDEIITVFKEHSSKDYLLMS